MQAQEVTQLLGITRERIKYFRKQEVFEPEHAPVGNKSPEYTRADVEKLKTLVILTKAGLSCGDIRKIQCGEWTLEEALASRRQDIMEELKRMQGSLSLVTELQQGKAEYLTMDTGFYWDVILKRENDGMDFIDVEAMYGAERAERLIGMRQEQMKLYVADGLIHPVKAARAHGAQNAYTESELEQMKAVAVLRRYLGTQEIKRLQGYPEETEALLTQWSEKCGEPLAQNAEVLSAVKKLQMLVRDAEDAHRLRRETKPVQIPVLIALLVCLAILALLSWNAVDSGYLLPGMLPRIAAGAVLLVALVSAVMTVRYATVFARAKRVQNHAVGTVVKVREETGFSTGYTRAGNSGSAFSEQGRGGAWVFFFLFWYALRPDRWFPEIRFETPAGDEVTATFCYGGLKNDWTEGEQVEIAWNDGGKGGLLPCGGGWMKRKAALYAALTAALVLAGVGLMIA